MLRQFDLSIFTQQQWSTTLFFLYETTEMVDATLNAAASSCQVMTNKLSFK